MGQGSQQYFIESAQGFAVITPSDTVNFSFTLGGQTKLITRGIYVGTTGNVVAVDQDNNAITFIAVPAGALLPICAKRVNSTNTTASNLVALI